MKWVKEGGAERWRARLDKADALGAFWECVVERRGGRLDAPVAAGPGGTLAGRGTPFPNDGNRSPGGGSWLWAIGRADPSGGCKLVGCAAALTREEAQSEAEACATSFVALARLLAELN